MAQKNKKRILQCAVIGVGSMGYNHARAYSALPGLRLRALADIDIKKAKTTAEKHKAVFYQDYNEMLKNEELDLVSVCVPTSLHYGVAMDCLRSNMNLIIEKPISSDITSAKRLLSSAKRKGLKLMVGHIERFNPAVRKVKELIDRGDLGEICAITARRVGGFPLVLKDTDIVVDLAIHDIDIVNFLLNEFPSSVSLHKRKNHIKSHEDSVEMFLGYKKASAYIQANWITPVKIRKLAITGTEGYLEMDYVDQHIDFFNNDRKQLKDHAKDYKEYLARFSSPAKKTIKVNKKEPLKEELLFMADCIKNNKDIDSSHAIEALRIALR